MSDFAKSDLRDGEILKILREIEGSPTVTQRELSSKMNISLGKVNYIINALINRGVVKANTFRKNNSKKAYFYVLTPHGLEEKAKAVNRFLKTKMVEYDNLKKEIEHLQKEIPE